LHEHLKVKKFGNRDRPKTFYMLSTTLHQNPTTTTGIMAKVNEFYRVASLI
jgi:hypothetical protein